MLCVHPIIVVTTVSIISISRGMKETNNRSKTDQNENDTTQFDRTNGVICHNAEHQTKTTAIQVNYTFQYCLHCGILKSSCYATVAANNAGALTCVVACAVVLKIKKHIILTIIICVVKKWKNTLQNKNTKTIIVSYHNSNRACVVCVLGDGGVWW